MRHPILAGAAALALAAGCGGKAGAPPVAPDAARVPDRCATPPAPAARDTVTLGFDRTVDADRVISRQLHGDAGAADCSGTPRDSGAYDLVRERDTLFAIPRAGARPVLRLRSAAADARDLIDGGADLVMTRDPRAVAYAAGRAGFVTLPLAWDRTYVLLSPAPLPVPGLRAAVRSDARAPEPPFWWLDTPVCRSDDFAGTNQARRRLLVPAGDPVARDLGERIVAGRPGIVVAPADSLSLAAALGRGMDAGYVVALPRTAPAACPTARWPAGWSAAALVDTRAWLILRAGALRVSTDADGLFRVIPPRP